MFTIISTIIINKNKITFIDIKYSNPTNGISLGQAIHNALTGSTIFQEGLSASQTSTG